MKRQIRQTAKSSNSSVAMSVLAHLVASRLVIELERVAQVYWHLCRHRSTCKTIIQFSILYICTDLKRQK